MAFVNIQTKTYSSGKELIEDAGLSDVFKRTFGAPPNEFPHWDQPEAVLKLVLEESAEPYALSTQQDGGARQYVLKQIVESARPEPDEQQSFGVSIQKAADKLGKRGITVKEESISMEGGELDGTLFLKTDGMGVDEIKEAQHAAETALEESVADNPFLPSVVDVRTEADVGGRVHLRV